MITHIQFRDGFPLSLPHFVQNGQSRRFEFTPGVNILFGPNGCGKSTILDTIKSYCFIEKGGWTKLQDPMKFGMNSIRDLPHALAYFAPGRVSALVGWDGTPTLYNKGDIELSKDWFFYDSGQLSDGITTQQEHVGFLADKPSTGQYRINRLNKIRDLIASPPTMQSPPSVPSPQVRNALEDQKKYMQSLNSTGRCTLLLDEPERALSVPMQRDLFNMITEIGQFAQVIVATHSPFCLGIKQSNVIDVVPNYSTDTLEAVKQILNT